MPVNEAVISQPQLPPRKRPGGPLPDWNLYAPISKNTPQGLKEVGVVTPDRSYFPFQHGEGVVFVKDNTGRTPHIRLQDGSTVRFDTWKMSRRKELQAIFDKINPRFALLYTKLMEDYPELEQMDVIQGTSQEYPVLEHTAGFWRRPETAQGNPAIVVNIDNASHASALMTSRETSARAAATQLGISFETLKAHPEILETFIFLHEIGHAHDYVNNYQRTLESVANPQRNPVEENRKVRTAEMNSLPVPGKNPADVRSEYNNGVLQSFFNTYRAHYQNMGINSPEELLEHHEIAYRNIPSEKYPDDFAAAIMKKYWASLGF